MTRSLTTLAVFFLLHLLQPRTALAQEGGTLHFEDGTVVAFDNLQRIQVCSVSSRGCAVDDGETKFPVYFEGSWRWLDFDKLVSIRVEEYSLGSSSACTSISDVVVTVKTVTGMTVRSKLSSWYYLYVELKDALSGERARQKYCIGDEGKRLLVREIRFSGR